jgi:photosystem II stability/assembly factor-like uncharacterized protein
VKGPVDIELEDTGRAARSGPSNGSDVATGKIYLRQQAFLEQRGLAREAAPLSSDGNGEPEAAEASQALYVQGARERSALLAEAPPEAALAWRSLGPAGIPDGQTYGTGPGANVTVSGRVTAIAVDPGDSGHILVGSAAGGIWETRDGGAGWTPRTDDQPTLSIGAMAFDPTDHSTVYAGTGEGNSEYLHLGQGILVSRDGGSTWSIIAANVFADVGFYRLVVDPRNGKRLLVATTGGAAISTDAGAGWSLLRQGEAWDVSLAYHGEEPEVLLTTPDGLFAGRGGAALAHVDLPGLSGTVDPRRERMAVAHVPSDPGQAYVFAASRGKAHLWHRATAGGPYKEIALPSFSVGRMVRNVFAVNQASYDWHLSIPLTGDDTIYLGAIELMKGVRTNGQWEWSDVSTRLNTGDSIHPDQHTMAFDAQDPAVVFAGNDGGIFRSPDASGSWESLNAGLAISEVEFLTQRPDEAIWLLAGLQDNGTIRREAADSWTQVGLGDGGDCATNMDTPNRCFHSYFFMFMERSERRADADSWEDATPSGDSDAQRKLFYPPLEVNGEVVVKAGEVVHLSNDSGRNWSDIALDQPASGRPSLASALAIPAPNRVLVGTIRGEVLALDFEGGHWSGPSALESPGQGWISDLLVDPSESQRLWVTMSSPGGVFRSDDGGSTWTDVTANLPSAPVNAVISDPAEPQRVWVACDVGVFETTDAGGSWSVFGSGLPNALAVDLLFYEPDRLLRVGTRSRGVWEIAV